MKVRGAHSIVMSILFRPGPLKTKLYGKVKLKEAMVISGHQYQIKIDFF